MRITIFLLAGKKLRSLLSRMRDPIRVAFLGTGQMGSGIASLVLEKQGLTLVGAYGRRKERAGMDLGRAVGLDRKLGVGVSAELAPMIEQTRPHVAIQATCSRITDAWEEVTTLVRLTGSPEIPGGLGTLALAVNMIPRVLNAPPGLHTMADLPVPAAMLGDARRLIHATPQERSHG